MFEGFADPKNQEKLTIDMISVLSRDALDVHSAL